MMSGSANPPSCSGEVSIAMANATSDSSLFKRPVDGKPRLLPSPTIRPGSPLRSSNKGHPARFSLWSCPAGGLAAARPTSPTHHMRDSDRGSSPSRLRSVTSMRALLPLQLGTGGGRGSSSLVCLTSQLRRTNSDPTANGQLGLRSPTSNTLVESVSMSLSTLSSTPALGGVKAQQALFDIGIFRPSIESQASPLAGAGSIEFEGEIGRCARAVSPTEESTLSLVDDIVGESEHDNVSDVGMDGVSQLDDEGHQDTASECSSMTSSQGMITIGALPECLVSSALGIRNTASESECPNQNLNEASWLEDASDDEGINGNSNLSRGLRLDEAFFQDRLKDVSNRPKLYNVQDTRIVSIIVSTSYHHLLVLITGTFRSMLPRCHPLEPPWSMYPASGHRPARSKCKAAAPHRRPTSRSQKSPVSVRVPASKFPSPHPRVPSAPSSTWMEERKPGNGSWSTRAM